MVYEFIGKVVLYIIGTLLAGAITSVIDVKGESWDIFFGAWLASIIVFMELIVPIP